MAGPEFVSTQKVTIGDVDVSVSVVFSHISGNMGSITVGRTENI